LEETVKPYKILAVDDESANLMLLKEVLQDDYHLIFAKNGQDALKRMSQNPDLVLLDIMMPEMDGYEVCRRLQENPATQKVPIIFLTAKISTQDEIKGFEMGASDYITKPLSPPVLKVRVKTQLALYDQNRSLEQKVIERTDELQRTRFQIIQRLGRASEYKDNETGLHVLRMSFYSKQIALSLGWEETQAELLLNAAPMHDVGKIGIPDQILLKPGKLTPEEWNIMRQHPVMGAEIIGEDDSELLSLARQIALYHHEKWDGSGYPFGKKGEEIPISARIIAIADVFDALTTERPYKKAWAVEDAVDFIKDQAERHFDPLVVDAFVQSLPEILSIKSKYLEKEIGVDC